MMEQTAQQPSSEKKEPFSIVEGVILIMVLITMLLTASVAYFTQGFRITFERMAEYDINHNEALVRIEALLKTEATAVTQPTAPIPNEHILYERPEYGFRVITTLNCKDVLQVNDGLPSTPGSVLEFSVLSNKNTLFNANTYELMSKTGAEALINDKSNLTPRILLLPQLPENRAIVQYQQQDPPPNEPFSDSAGQYCHHIVQATLPQP